MHRFDDLSIRRKLLLVFLLILAVSSGLGVFSAWHVARLGADTGAIEKNVGELQTLSMIAKDGEQMANLSALVAASLTPEQTRSLTRQENAVRADEARQWAVYAQSLKPGEESRYADMIKMAFGKISADSAQINSDNNAGDVGDIDTLLMNDLSPQLDLFNTAINADIAYKNRRAADLAKTANAAQTAAIAGIIVMISGLLLVIAGAVWMVRRCVTTPIMRMTEAMRRLAAHDVGAVIPGIGRHDEIGAMAAAMQVFKENAVERARLETEAVAFHQELDRKLRDSEAAFEAAGRGQRSVVEGMAGALARLAKGDLTARLVQDVDAAYAALKTDFNGAMQTLQETMQAITANTRCVHDGSDEIMKTSDELARRTEQQAAGLESVATALDAITTKLRGMAEDTNQARDMVTAAKGDAERSGGVVRETVMAMGQIEASSRQITSIIGVIDEIAFQTNLLALNAGVEAARAGDAGRGFAVVATEVRALAQRSANAAKEIKALILASSQQVATGVQLVGETGKALERIVGQVGGLNRLVAGIAQSAQEQSAGLGGVNETVRKMDRVTHDNAAMVDATTKANHELALEARQLARLVGRFETGQRRQAQLPAPAPMLATAVADR